MVQTHMVIILKTNFLNSDTLHGKGHARNPKRVHEFIRFHMLQTFDFHRDGEFARKGGAIAFVSSIRT